MPRPRPGLRILMVSAVLLHAAGASDAAGPGRRGELVRCLHDDLVAGATVPAFHHLVRLYEEEGVPLSDNLRLEEQSSFELLSVYREGGELRQSRLLGPGEGFRYWQTWSEAIAGGNFDPAAVFADEEEARRIGNFALLGIMAHELGHHAAEIHGRNTDHPPFRELVADEFAVRMMRVWAAEPAMRELVSGYREKVAGRLRAAVPDGVRAEPWPSIAPPDLARLRELAATMAPPEGGVAGYVSLQLARQAALLDQPELSSLAEFMAEAPAPATIPVTGTIDLATVADGEVPAWMRTDGSPATLWSIPESALASAVAGSLGVAPEAVEAGAPRTLWTMAGPTRALWMQARPDLWPDDPVRIQAVTLGADRSLSATTVATGNEIPGRKAVLLARDGARGAVVTWVDLRRRPPALRWLQGEAGGRLLPGDLDGMPLASGRSPDGGLSSLDLLPGAGQLLPVGPEAIVVCERRRLRLVEGRRIRTLAGGNPGHRDGREPHGVRLEAARLLGVEGRTLWFESRGRSGPVTRRLAW